MKVFIQLLIVSVFIFSSCSVKKRSYRNGYYITWNHKSKHAPQAVKKNNEPLVQHEHERENGQVVDDSRESSFASIKDDVVPFKGHKPKWNLFKDTCGDIITLRKGSEVKARVLEINETQIKYKRCDNPDGPLIIVNKNEVYSIKYTNGMLEHFDRTVVIRAKNNNGEKQIHPLAYATLACTVGILLLSFIALIAALIIGTIAKAKILREPDKYSGLEMVKICMTICWVLLILAVVLFIVLLTFIAGII